MVFFNFVIDNSAMLAENLRMRFNERTIATQHRVKDLMDLSGRETWNCDQEPNEYRYKGIKIVKLNKIRNLNTKFI